MAKSDVISSLEEIFDRAYETNQQVRKVLGDKLFSGVAWTIEIVARPNGTSYWQLTELAGKLRTDFPTIHPGGSVAYDRPERLPTAVKSWAERHMKKAVK